MAKTTAPLLSFEARGQIAKTQVYANWRGIAYSRRYVIPSNPRTAGQTQTRGVFDWLNQAWKLLDPAVQAVWTAFTKGKPLMNRNAWQKSSLTALRGATGAAPVNLEGLVISPGVGGGLAPATFVGADAGGHGLELTATAPALPTGWAITKCHFVAFVSVEAATSNVYASQYVSDNAAPYQQTFANAAGATYDAFAFFEFTKPNGATAYGPSKTVHTVVA